MISSDWIEARKTVIKMATLAPEGTPWYALIAKMGERWNEETKGNIRLRIYPGGIVGDEREVDTILSKFTQLMIRLLKIQVAQQLLLLKQLKDMVWANLEKV